MVRTLVGTMVDGSSRSRSCRPPRARRARPRRRTGCTSSASTTDERRAVGPVPPHPRRQELRRLNSQRAGSLGSTIARAGQFTVSGTCLARAGTTLDRALPGRALRPRRHGRRLRRDDRRLDAPRREGGARARDPGRGAARGRRRRRPRDADARARARPGRRARRRLPRAQRAAARRARAPARGWPRCSAAARRRAGGSASSPPSGARPSSSRSTGCPLEHLFEVVVASDDTERHKPDPEPMLARARPAGRRAADERPTSATRPSTSAPRRRRACYAVAVTWGGIHRARALERGAAGRARRHAEELLGVL